MAATFAFHRSTYNPLLDTTQDNYALREQVTNIGSNAGNFFNWTWGERSLGWTWPDGGSITGNLFPTEADNPDPNAYYLYPLSANNCSLEVYLRANFTGVTGLIDNIRMVAFKLDLTGYGDGATVRGRSDLVYPTGDPDLAYVNDDGNAGPLNTRYGDTFNALQVSLNPDTGSIDLTPAGGISTDGLSNYAVLQLWTGPNADPGEGGSCDFALFYDES